MRQARIKVDAEEGEAVYHCMTRTVNGERLLDDVAKEVLRKTGGVHRSEPESGVF